jgi:predicted nuclease of predicted toxin-antitoxin system
VKLLFDENLSPRLVESVASLYAGSLHVRDCGLLGGSDEEVWQYARQNGFAIVSKDSDFRHKSNLFGGPPKVIWLQIGNCTTRHAEFILINMVTRIQDFLLHGEESCLVLKHAT